MTLLRFLLVFLLSLALPLGLTGCPSGDDDDSGAANDDDVADDDDDDDDDDGADDDDATGAPLSCDGTLPVVNEAEPNDKAAQALSPDGEGFCIEGNVTCGNEAYLDNDLFVFQLPEARTVSVSVNWTGVSDVDSYGYIGEVSEEPLFGFEEGFTPPELGEIEAIADQDYLLQVACWDGGDTPYTLTVTYDALTAGDDDDSAGDDDDSAGDDDDSAGDDDDSAPVCVQEVLGNNVDDDCDGETDEYTFSDVYTLLLSANCSCHAGASHSTGWFFNNDQATAYSNLVNVPSGQLSSMQRILPGSSLSSYLMHKLDGTQAGMMGSGSQMPLSGGPLTTAQIEGVRGWINSGAAND